MEPSAKMEQNLYGDRACSSEIAASEATLNEEGAVPSTERTALLPPGINIRYSYFRPIQDVYVIS